MKMNISKIKRNANNLFHSQLFWIQVCAIGIWLLVIQNFLGGEDTAQRVYVVGGNIDADIRGSVDIDNTVEVVGSVDVDNTVPVRVTNPVMTW